MTERFRASEMPDEIDAGYGGVVLRRAQPIHGELIRERVNDDPQHFWRVGEIMPRHCISPEAIQRWITGEPDEDNKHPSTRYGIWACDDLVGCAGHIDNGSDIPQLWYWLGAKYVGKGHATAAAQTYTWELFRRDVPQIDAWVRVGNIKSSNSLVRAGYKLGNYVVALNGHFVQYYAINQAIGA